MEKILISCSNCDFEFETTEEFLPKFRIMDNKQRHIDLINVPLNLQCPKCWGVVNFEVIDE